MGEADLLDFELVRAVPPGRRLEGPLLQPAGRDPTGAAGLGLQHASLMLESGADIAVVSKRLGNSTITITSDLYSD